MQIAKRANMACFDTDSGSIGVDNRCSACISHQIADFEGQVKKVNRAIKGFGGERVLNVYMGTIIWKWHDNNGQTHRFKIPNSYYIPDGNCRLLSPQHWAKTQVGGGSRSTRATGTGETTYFNKCVLFWDRNKYQLDIPMDQGSNVATFHLAPGFGRYDLFCQECSIRDDQFQEESITAMPTGMVSDDEDDDDDDVLPPRHNTNNNNSTFWTRLTRGQQEQPKPTPTPTTEDLPQPTQTTFDLDGPTTNSAPKPVVIEEEEEKQPTTAAQELLRYHHRFGHCSFAKLKRMAELNIIPRHLAKVTPPTCSACLFAKATRKQWRNKRRKHWNNQRVATKPGEVISVD